jgi:hypothetical protein
MEEMEIEEMDIVAAGIQARINAQEEPRPPINWSELKDIDVYVVSELLQDILDRAKDEIDELLPEELELWKEHFKYVVTDGDRLNSEQLLGSHDMWLRTIQQEVDSQRMDAFFTQADNISDADALVEFALSYFTPSELAAFDINDRA